MKLRRQSGRGIFTLALVAVVLLGGVTRARGQAYRVIHDFRGWPDDGCEIVGVPAVANNGDLYGVTYSCGTYEYYGTVFKLTAPRTRGGAWTKTILHDFPGAKEADTRAHWSLARMAICTALTIAKPFLN